MKRKRFYPAVLASVFLMFLASAPLSHAYGIDVSFDSYTKTVYHRQPATFGMTISNFLGYGDLFSISVKGEHLEWYQPLYLAVFIPSGESKAVNLTFFPTGFDSGRFEYDVEVSSNTAPKISEKKTLVLNVLRRTDIYNLSAESDGQTVYFSMTFESIESVAFDIKYEAVNEDGEVIASSTETLSIGKGKRTLQRRLNLPEKTLAGNYTLRVSIDSMMLSKETQFEIKPVHNVVITTIKETTPLYEDVVVSIRNDGNVIESNVENVQTLPNNDWVTGLVTEPEKCEPVLDKKNCKYVIDNLRPGETAFITYRLEFWPIYAQYAFAAIVIISVVAYSFLRASRPKIVKRHVRKAGGKHSIVIEIKNPFLKTLKNVIVRDWVSPLAHVVHDEVEAVKPALKRRTDAGTELIWKLGDIGPNETRIITYHIKPLVYGSLKMPRAYMRYHDEKGKRSRVLSKQLVLE